MDGDSLKAIWTMVDSPVDNKLDALEFSLAMHLIVCVTKKGLPLPQGGALPASLSRLVMERRQQQQQQQQQQLGAQQPGAGAAVPPSPRGMPSPDKLGMMQQQQPQMMNGGMMQQQQQQMPQPPLGVQQQPQMGGVQPPCSFGVDPNATVGVDDAFAGLSNDPVPSVDEYSTAGGVQDGQDEGGMSTVGYGQADGGMSTINGDMSTMGFGGHRQQPVVEVASPEPSPSLAPQEQPRQYDQPPLSVQEREPPEQQPTPRAAATSVPASAHADSNAAEHVELLELRSAHQKLQAEVVSLRAKAASVTDEEQQAQREIATLAGQIGKLSLELSELKESIMENKLKLSESLGLLKVKIEKKE